MLIDTIIKLSLNLMPLNIEILGVYVKVVENDNPIRQIVNLIKKQLY